MPHRPAWVSDGKPHEEPNLASAMQLDADAHLLGRTSTSSSGLGSSSHGAVRGQASQHHIVLSIICTFGINVDKSSGLATNMIEIRQRYTAMKSSFAFGFLNLCGPQNAELNTLFKAQITTNKPAS